MAIKQIGENSVTEFFEEITFQVGYNEAREQVKDFTKNVDNDIVKEALESSMQVLTMGLLMLMIRYQEDFVQKVFTLAEGLVVLLLASDYVQRARNRLASFRGFKFLKRFEMFQHSYSDRIATARLVLQGASNHLQGERVTQSESSTFNTMIQQKEHIVNKERLHMELANSMAGRYNDSLLFKMFTKSFTENDKLMIKKILGRDTSATLDIADLNQVADFLYVKDSAGKVTGLSEQFMTFINGLGYTHNK